MEEEYIVDIEKITSQIEEWTKNNLEKSFKFRKHQKEAIANIINRIVNNENHNIIIEAPTGSGKSLINIIASQVLWEYYKIDSYILCSDLYLFDQYEKFVDEHPYIPTLAAIKGQTGNYKCSINSEDIRYADCQLSGISWSSLIRRDPYVMKKGFRCCGGCKYVRAREKALKSPVTITTYQNLLFQLNIVYKRNNENCTFAPRQVIFCDEAHNIPNIIQMKYTPEVRHSDLNALLKIIDYYNFIKDTPEWNDFISSTNEDCMISAAAIEQGLDEDASEEQKNSYVDITNRDEVISVFEKSWSVFVTPNPSIDDLEDALLSYHNLLLYANMIQNILGTWITTKKRSKYDKLPEDLFDLWKTNVWLANYCCVYSDFNMAWTNENTGSKYILKQIHGEENSEAKDLQKSLFSEYDDTDNRMVTFNCTKEDYLVYVGLLAWAQFRVFISATIGGKDNFCENNGIHFTEDEYASFDRVPTIFNFDKSPINFLNRYSMSFKERNTSLPKICKMVQKLCKRHENEKGIIQTGSYALTKQLIDSLDKETKERLLTYNGSREKIKIAQLHKNSRNTILIGPSLNQGIDLPDENVRFIIILKVPYPSLTDSYVKEKIRLFPRWYEATTTTEIIQGIGRGVRNENDWCVTYILDSCFYKLYLNTMDQFSDELKDRLKIYN